MLRAMKKDAVAQTSQKRGASDTPTTTCCSHPTPSCPQVWGTNFSTHSPLSPQVGNQHIFPAGSTQVASDGICSSKPWVLLHKDHTKGRYQVPVPSPQH